MQGAALCHILAVWRAQPLGDLRGLSNPGALISRVIHLEACACLGSPSRWAELAVHGAERLAAKGHRVCESGDAGRYVCNYLYFNSLRQVQAARASSPDRDWHALFVHMPPTAVCPMTEQYQFAQDLFQEISAWFQTRELPLITHVPASQEPGALLTDKPALAPA